MKFIEMSDYNGPAKIYWSIMVAAGLLTGAWGFYHCLTFTSAEWGQFIALLSLVLITSSYPIRIPNTTASVTAGDTFTFLSVFLLGVPAAIVLGVADSFVSSHRTTKRTTSWIGAPAMMATSVFLSGHAFYLTLASFAHINAMPLGVQPIQTVNLLVPLAVMTIVQYMLNGFSVATMCALKSRRSIWKFWHDGYLWTSWTFIAAAITAAVVYVSITTFGFVYVLIGIPVITVTYATYRIYFERVNEKTREASEMSRIHLATVEALATAIDAKDQTTHCHVRRVQIFAAGMGKFFGLSDSEIQALEAGALLHDIGKLAVPDHILNKPGRLTVAEFEKMKVHTTVGAEILSRVDFPYPVVPIVRHHHEQWNGLGYPDGLKGDEIPMTARILAVVDCFDSIREDRPYRPGMTREEASALLLRGAGVTFDPAVVNAFLQNLPRFEQKIAALNLDPHGVIDRRYTLRTDDADSILPDRGIQPDYLDQIKNAHREVYALYEIARTFGSSLDVKDTLAIIVNKVGHIVPFDTCAVYLHDVGKGCAEAAHVAGKNSDILLGRCVVPGEGVTGFTLANRRSINRIDPALDFQGVHLSPGTSYRSMASLPLVKDERMFGALSVYSSVLENYTDDHMRLLDTVVRLASDALANAMQHAQTESNALTDPLTGLANARSMYVRFEQEVSRANRTNRPFQVVMLDLDDFKQVNDNFGHKAGDQMLREVARLIQAQLREYDFLARYAGDEFVGLVQELVGDQVDELRGRIEKAISTFLLPVNEDTYANVGISVGCATYGVDGETLDQLLITADQAMYACKAEHKQRRRLAALGHSDNISETNSANLASTAVN